MKIINVQQLSGEWFQAHCGKVTGSHMKALLDITKKGEPGSTRKTYFRTKLAEMLTGVAIQDNYVSKEMLDGIEREPIARAAYEAQEECMVEEVGFVMHDSIERFGCSPDGLVDQDGGVEIKCPKAGTHLHWIMNGKIPEEHTPQLRAELSVTGLKWIDFVSFNPEVPKPLRLMVIRMTHEQADVGLIEEAVQQFISELDAAVERLRNIAGHFDLPAAQKPESPEAQKRALDGFLTDEDFEGLSC